uniref:Uncharacterized protein n=1 Tax=Ceratitis capitata TaxID=7213 RepID=W8CDD9_CERCA
MKIFWFSENLFYYFQFHAHDIQFACIIGTPSGERLNGCIRQCLTTGQHASQHWKSSAARLFLTLSTAQQQKTRTVKRKRGKSKFNRVKKHAPHRRPDLLRRIIAQQKLLG